MKTTILALAITFISFAAFAGNNAFNYIATKNDTFICSKVRIGFLNTRCKLMAGGKVKLPSSDIQSAFIRNKWYVRKPVYINNIYAGKDALMALLDCHKGIRVYTYKHFNPQTETNDLLVYFYKQGVYLNYMTNATAKEVYAYINKSTKSLQLSNQ
jgi:hypothetical protein